MVANVYIDGFNLYYRALRAPGKRWLNLRDLCAASLPQEEIHRIRYFTARVSARQPGDHDPQRQDVYLKALKSVSNLHIHYGHYLSSQPTMKRVDPPGDFVKVFKSEEKGSDVNLASYLLLDAFRSDADTFVVLSNDTDLVEPLRIVKHELAKRTGALYPHRKSSGALRTADPDFFRVLKASDIEASQFPDSVQLPDGSRVSKPQGW